MARRQSRKKAILGVIIAVVVIAAFGCGLYLLEHHDGRHKHKAVEGTEAVEPTILYLGDDEYEITHNVESYLLIGTDDSGKVKAEGTRKYRGRMADFLLLLVLDRTDNTYGFLQIDRNTMTDVPYMDTDGNGEGNAFEQICTANWYGGKPEHGCNNCMYCVSQLLGEMPIQGYYTIHMSDVGILNHAVGGVQITLEDDFSAEDPAMTKGTTLVLNDKQAEIFVRGRMNIGEGDNASRMARQRQYMQGFKSKAWQKLGTDASFIDSLYKQLEDDAVTTIPPSEVSVIVNQMYKGEDLGILDLDGKTKIGTTLKDGKKHEEFYPKTSSIADCMVKLCGIDEEHIHIYGEDDEYFGEDE